jgi:hypothetical protein
MNKSTKTVIMMLVGAATFGLYSASVSAEQPEIIPNGRGIGTRLHPPQGDAHAAAAAVGTNGISYHGGPVILNGTHVYYIWYGNWGSAPARTILPALAVGLSGSPYFNINTTYTNASGQRVLNAVSLSGQYVYPTPYKTTLTDADIQTIVGNSLTAGGVAYDAQGVYFVLTSPEVHESSGFCTQYCGWHTRFSWNGKDVKYSFVGDAATQCPGSCIASTSTPNGDAGADGMASVLAHELEEATTDPDLNAWYDRRGNENADKCAWTFGTTKAAPNGAQYNMILGTKYFLIQQNWVNAAGGYCALSY